MSRAHPPFRLAPKTPPARPAGAPAAAPAPARPLSPAVLDEATDRLAIHIGPVAKLLVKRAAKQASSTRDLYEQLAAHIDDPQSRQRFTAAVEDLSEPRARPPWARVAPARGSQWAV